MQWNSCNMVVKASNINLSLERCDLYYLSFQIVMSMKFYNVSITPTRQEECLCIAIIRIAGISAD